MEEVLAGQLTALAVVAVRFQADCTPVSDAHKFGREPTCACFAGRESLDSGHVLVLEQRHVR
jgi:hypothetical protein